MRQQMEMMSRQLETSAAGGYGARPAAAGSRRPHRSRPAIAARLSASPDRATIAFGPYRPPAKGPAGGLTPRQQQAL